MRAAIRRRSDMVSFEQLVDESERHGLRAPREDVVPPSSSPPAEDMVSRHKVLSPSPWDGRAKLQRNAQTESLHSPEHSLDRAPVALRTRLAAQDGAEADTDRVEATPASRISVPTLTNDQADCSQLPRVGITSTERSSRELLRSEIPSERHRSLDLNVWHGRVEDHLQTTQTSSKDSESFLESRDRQLSTRSEQGLQLTDMLGGIRATRMIDSQRIGTEGPSSDVVSRSSNLPRATSAQGYHTSPGLTETVTTRCTNSPEGCKTIDKPHLARSRQRSTHNHGSDASRTSRLNTLPNYRRLGRTRELSALDPHGYKATQQPKATSPTLLERAAGIKENPGTERKEAEPHPIRTGLALGVQDHQENASRTRRLSAKVRAFQDRNTNSDSSSEPEIEGDETYRPAQPIIRKLDRWNHDSQSSEAGSPDELALASRNPSVSRKRSGIRQERRGGLGKKRKLNDQTTSVQLPSRTETGHSRVFARWSSDRAFYPGSVKGVSGKRLTIFFDDETTDEVEWHHVRKCEIKAGDVVVDLSHRPFKDVTVMKSVHGPLQPAGKIAVQRGSTSYELLTSQIRIREKWISQMDDRKVQFGDIAVDPVWNDSRTRYLPEQQLLRATTPNAKGTKQASVTSSPGQTDRKFPGMFDSVGFLITSPSHNEENRKRKVAKRITSHGGVCANDIWDFYEKTQFEQLSQGYTSIKLKDSAVIAGLKGVFLIVIGPPTLTPKYLMSLALGVPCLSANYIDEAISSVG